MPSLFSSLSLKEKDGGSHHNKLGKSPHARGASLTGRKFSIGQKPRADEDASTKAIEGSQSQPMHDDTTGTENVKPLTPRSLNGDHLELHDAPPSPPPRDTGYTKAVIDPSNDDSRRDSIRTTSTTTWRENPDAVAMRNRTALNDAHAGTGTGTAGLGQEFDSQGFNGNKIMDIATARKKIQIAIEAELAADRALEAARNAVDEARAMVTALEKQTHEECVLVFIVVSDLLSD